MKKGLYLALGMIVSLSAHAGPDIDALLKEHNAARAAVGVEPLVWSAEVAAGAQEWADQLAAKTQFQHSNTPLGENLWAGTAGAYSASRMVQSWVGEKADFKFGTFPDVTTGGVVGHYTQIVWRKTTAVGCGLAAGNGMDYLVCRYSPAGNYYGQQPY